MRRRQAIASLITATMLLPSRRWAQSASRTYRIGQLIAGARTPDGAPPAALRESMRALGYVEGKNVRYEARFAEGRTERLPALAAELVALKVDVIVSGGGAATEAARKATTSIPIVMAPAAGDAVALGWIASVARPGGNVTGLTDESNDLSAKRMQLLREALPKAGRIAVLWNESDQGMTLRYRAIEKAARSLNLEVQAIGVRDGSDFPAAFSAMERRRPDAVFVVSDALTSAHRRTLIDFATANRIPSMYEQSFNVRDGGLMSYGYSFEDSYRVAARYVDQILKGSRPADLPAEHPTRYYLMVNLKAAEALGLHLSTPLLLRADEVIQ
jgi:putative ABC transport system substrate-binding protein